jgi:penicillin-binding protein 1A
MADMLRRLLDRFSSRRAWVLLIVLALLLWLCGMAVLRQLLTNLPDIEAAENYAPPVTTKIYDVKGELVTEFFKERRTLIPLTFIPPALQQAIQATEDQHFKEHWGINLKGIARATIANLRHGRVVEGGSTITQQLSKVLFTNRERTLTRKLRELLLAIELERRYSKEEILQMYLNQIYFGHGAYGVQAAASTYFGKNVKDLTLPECALLAGMPRSPANYSPFKKPESAKRRRAWVLSRMRKSGYISSQEESIANTAPLVTEKTKQGATGAYFVEYLRILLEPKYGEDALFEQGLSIHTTLDVKMQRAAEEAMETQLKKFDEDKLKELAEEAKKKGKKTADVEVSSSTMQRVQGALVAIDPRTGGIRAMVGGRDFRESQFNRAIQAQRQPGSAFKPFVWTAAMDNGMTPATIVSDDPVAFYNDGREWKLLESATSQFQIAAATAPFPSDQVWVPKNWDNKYFGAVTLRTGLAQSRNLVSIRVADFIGAGKVVEVAKRLGIKSRLGSVLSIALGTEQVNLLELTAAYAPYVNSGLRVAPYAITRIEDQNGKILEENPPEQSVELSPETAYLMTTMLQAVTTEGTGRRTLSLGRPVAGKTGTNQDLRDLWFVGYTADLVTGAWMGYDDFQPLGKGFTASSKVIPWWTEFMRKAHEGVPVRRFSVPEGMVFAKIDAKTGLRALGTCPKVVLQAFKAGTEPQDFCPIDHFSQAERELEAEE